MDFDVEPATVFRIIVLIMWVMTAIGFVFLMTAPHPTETLIKYIGWFCINTVLVLADWVIVGKIFGEVDEEDRENFSEAFDTRTFEANPARYWGQLFVKNLWIILIISVAIGIAWSTYYSMGINASKGYKAFLMVPNMFSTVPMISSPIPFVDTPTVVAFFEAFTVSVTEETFFSGILHPTLVGLAILGLTRLFKTGKNGFIIMAILLMIIMAFPSAWISTNMMHFFAYSQNQYAYDNAFQHFLYADLIDGSLGNILPSFIAHLGHNFELKYIKYHGGLQAIAPVYGDTFNTVP